MSANLMNVFSSLSIHISVLCFIYFIQRVMGRDSGHREEDTLDGVLPHQSRTHTFGLEDETGEPRGNPKALGEHANTLEVGIKPLALEL